MTKLEEDIKKAKIEAAGNWDESGSLLNVEIKAVAKICKGYIELSGTFRDTRRSETRI